MFLLVEVMRSRSWGLNLRRTFSVPIFRFTFCNDVPTFYLPFVHTNPVLFSILFDGSLMQFFFSSSTHWLASYMWLNKFRMPRVNFTKLKGKWKAHTREGQLMLVPKKTNVSAKPLAFLHRPQRRNLFLVIASMRNSCDAVPWCATLHKLCENHNYIFLRFQTIFETVLVRHFEPCPFSDIRRSGWDRIGSNLKLQIELPFKSELVVQVGSTRASSNGGSAAAPSD